MTTPVFGTDGVLYLLAAQALLEQGLDASLALYNYPSYPALIALAHSLTALPFHHAAHLINALCMALLVWSFIRLAERCYPGPFIAPAAAAVILLNPEVNGIRFDIFRDYGYWAFVVLAIERFVAFNEKPSLLNASTWFMAILMAAFFRPEAILLTTVPLLYLIYHPESLGDSLRRLFRILLLPLLLLGSAIVAHLLGLSDLPAYFIDTLSAKIAHRWVSIDAHFLNLVGQYQQTVLDPRNKELAVAAIIGSFASVLIVKLLKSLHFIYLLGLFYALFKEKVRLKPNGRWVIIAWLLVLSSIPVLFLISERFLDERYVTILTLLACLPLAPLLARLYQRSEPQRFMRRFGVLIILLLIDGFISFGAKHDYFFEVRDWLSSNTPSNARLVTNDLRAIYSVKRSLNWADSEGLIVQQDFNTHACDNADFYIHKHKRHEKHAKVQGNALLQVFFSNKRKQHIDIYRCIKPLQDAR